MRALAWLARLILVLLLVVDQMGAPLHAHRHDSGVDARPVAIAHLADFADESHAESPPEIGGGHAMLAVRGEARGVVAEPSDDAERQSGMGAIAFAMAVAPAEEIKSSLWMGAPPWSPSIHRNLPPAGRAPPLHA